MIYKEIGLEIGLGVLMCCLVVLAMIALLLLAKSKLVQSGQVTILVNDDADRAITCSAGSNLLTTLANQKVFIPSACGGGGTCGQCRVQVHSGGGDLLPTEQGHINRGEAKDNWRLSCQVKVKEDMSIELEPEIFSVKKWDCEVISNHNVATFIKEMTLQLPEGESIDYKSGGYIQIEVPAHDVSYNDFSIEDEYRGDWDEFNMWRYRSAPDEPCARPYSMASYPAEGNLLMLNVRIASPPPRGPEGIPPGKGSSFIFAQRPGDTVTISGPYGDFYLQDNDREMVFIGGGAGMAPMRSHLMHLFRTVKTEKKVSFWYGARSLREAFYVEEFDEIAEKFPNFTWHLALDNPLPEDNWSGYTGFIHQVLLENYLNDHPEPEDCQYYLCGPPMMNRAVINMLHDLGVEPEDVFLDDFGG